MPGWGGLETCPACPQSASPCRLCWLMTPFFREAPDSSWWWCPVPSVPPPVRLTALISFLFSLVPFLFADCSYPVFKLWIFVFLKVIIMKLSLIKSWLSIFFKLFAYHSHLKWLLHSFAFVLPQIFTVMEQLIPFKCLQKMHSSRKFANYFGGSKDKP